MNTTVTGALQVVTLAPYVVFAGYCFFFRGDIPFGLVFLGLEAFSVIFLLLKRRIQYDTPDKKRIADAARLAFLWAFNLLFFSLLFRDTPYWNILSFLPWTPFVLFFVWAKCTGRWKVALRVRF